MNSFVTRVNESATKYLDRRGYEIIEEPWKTNKGMLPVDIVAKEDNSIVFCTVKGRDADNSRSFEPDSLDRDKLEAFAIDWFEKNAKDYEDMHFRFDVVSMLVISNARALIRHHINAMSLDCHPEEE